MDIDQHDNKWLGTTWGLVKYDGSNWQTYPKKSKKDIQFTTVRSITIDPAGSLWTGTWGDGMAQLRFPEGNPNDATYSYT